MTSRLQRPAGAVSGIGEVRGLGAMVAIELVKNCSADQPDAELTKAVGAGGRPPRAVILLSCGIYAKRHPLPGAADDLGCAAEGRLQPVRTGAAEVAGTALTAQAAAA